MQLSENWESLVSLFNIKIGSVEEEKALNSKKKVDQSKVENLSKKNGSNAGNIIAVL